MYHKNGIKYITLTSYMFHYYIGRSIDLTLVTLRIWFILLLKLFFLKSRYPLYIN